MFYYQPPIYIRFDEIDNVNFARESTKNRSFEFQVEAKTGTKYTFGTIDRSEYTSLFDFAKSHGLTIRNIGASHKELTNNPDDLSSEVIFSFNSFFTKKIIGRQYRSLRSRD